MMEFHTILCTCPFLFCYMLTLQHISVYCYRVLVYPMIHPWELSSGSPVVRVPVNKGGIFAVSLSNISSDVFLWGTGYRVHFFPVGNTSFHVEKFIQVCTKKLNDWFCHYYCVINFEAIQSICMVIHVCGPNTMISVLLLFIFNWFLSIHSWMQAMFEASVHKISVFSGWKEFNKAWSSGYPDTKFSSVSGMISITVLA